VKVVILAGGAGTRLGEVTKIMPKPMVKIGGKPILWHIMKIYSHYGYNDFVICLGYKGNIIKKYFNSYKVKNPGANAETHKIGKDSWKVALVDTGKDSLTALRIQKIRKYLGNEDFMLTYGDGVSNINIKKLVAFHENKKKLVTVTGVQPMGRFGALEIGKNCKVRSFNEKPREGWINGGFFVLKPGIFNYFKKDENVLWEKEPVTRIVKANQVVVFKHNGFWQPMDTLRDKNHLDELWTSGKASWRIWR